MQKKNDFLKDILLNIRQWLVVVLLIVNVFFGMGQDSQTSTQATQNSGEQSKNSGNKLQQNDTTKRLLQEVSILSSRGAPRTAINTPVPIDIINVQQVAASVPQTSLGNILNFVAPSFSSTSQTINDGTDHVDPATLRGLSPDKTLVLVNGKRRYQSALINVNNSVGRGSVATDLNAIPVSSISKIEVLRDGASAQYGSDAIAGVINITLNRNIGHTIGSVSIGGNVTQYEAMNYNTIGDYANNIVQQYQKYNAQDGLAYQFNINRGFALSKKNDKSFINVSITYDSRGYTNRAGEYTSNSGLVPPGSTLTANQWLTANNLTRNNFRVREGQSKVQNLQTMINGNININANTDWYFFGGYGFRWGQSGGFYRTPFNSRNNLALYPHGFLPLINSRIQDYSFATGVRGLVGLWNYDVSNTIGGNIFSYIISNSINTSAMGTGLPAATQTTFNAGALAFLQNTTNADFNRNFKVLYNLNVAFGAEARVDNYRQIAGEESSWANYQRHNKATGNRDIFNGDTVYSIQLANGAVGVPAGGSQVFPGFQPKDALNKSRLAIGAYGEAALDITKQFLIDAAIRLENYTDFGFNASEKLALRYKINDHFAVRVSGSTGFKAPSLQQEYYSTTSTQIISGTLYQVLVAPNTSQVVKLLGGKPLRPEIAYSTSAGFTSQFKGFKFTVDGFYTYLQNRIILTDVFSGNPNGTPTQKEIYNILLVNSASQVQFFTNAINTQTYGVDAVFSYFLPITQQHSINFDLSGNYSQTDIVGDVQTSDLLVTQKHIYLSPKNIANLTKYFPRVKSNFMVNYTYKNFSVFARESFVGGVSAVDRLGSVGSIVYYYEQKINPVFVTDLSISYQFPKGIRATIGVNNLFDAYPDALQSNRAKYLGLETDANKSTYNQIVTVRNYKEMTTTGLLPNNNALTNNNQLQYPSNTTQIGFNGRFIFGRIEINF